MLMKKIIEKNLPTYGEAWFEWKKQFSIHSKINFNDIKTFEQFKSKERMVGEKGIKYYKEKIKCEFERLGYVREPKLRDFDSAEDYFGYFEALKLKKKLIKIDSL